MGLRDWLEEWFARRRAMDSAPTFCCTASSVELSSMENEIEEAVAAGQVPLTADGTFVRDGRCYDLGLLKEERLRAAQAIGETLTGAGIHDGPAEPRRALDLADEVSHEELVNPHGVIAGEEAERAAEARAAAGTVTTIPSSHQSDGHVDDIREPDLVDHHAGLVEDERRRRMSMSDVPMA